MGFWERLNANPGDNLDALKRAEDQRRHLRKSIGRATAKNESAIDRLKDEVVALRAELEATQQEQSAALDRLTRCLIANEIIEPADLAAVLPASTVSDDEPTPG